MNGIQIAALALAFAMLIVWFVTTRPAKTPDPKYYMEFGADIDHFAAAERVFGLYGYELLPQPQLWNDNPDYITVWVQFERGTADFRVITDVISMLAENDAVAANNDGELIGPLRSSIL